MSPFPGNVILRPGAGSFPVPTFFPCHGYPSLSTMTDAPGPEPVSPLCRVCAHLHRGAGSPACDAFPGGIPDAIRAGERHVDPYPGDGGIVFRKTSGEASFFIAEAQPGILFRVTAAGSYERYVPILDLWDLDNRFIGYVLSVPFPFRPVDASDAEAFMESSRECLDAMNPCMREVRRMMYLQTREHEVP